MAALWAIFLVPETAGASLEEIDRVFNSSAGKDDAENRQKACDHPNKPCYLLIKCLPASSLSKSWDCIQLFKAYYQTDVFGQSIVYILSHNLKGCSR